MKRMVFVGVTAVVGALVFGLGSTAGAANYPPKAKMEVAVEGKSASTQTAPSSGAVGAPLPFTGSDSAELVWAGATLLVAGAALVGRQRRAVRR